MSTALGVLLCALGLALLALACRVVWRGMVHYDSPTPADRSRRANEAGAHLYNSSRPRVVRVRFTRRRYVPRPKGESKD